MAEQQHIAEEHTQYLETMGIRESIQRPLKVVFLGAGSHFFQGLFRDILLIPGADRGEMALVDVDESRLRPAETMGNMIIRQIGCDWTVTATTDHRTVLAGADYIINCIDVSGVETVQLDNDIPKRYGVDQCIADTLGPGGLFKALRTAPVLLDILHDVEQFCPEAWVLNYTNPMSILCLAAHRDTRVKMIGLCHSVQNTSHRLAEYLDIPYNQLSWQCAGINHLAWFTRLRRDGEDLYPALRTIAETDTVTWQRDPVRFDMMRHFGYFITESSGHLSEYLPYYRKRKDLLEHFCSDESYLGESGYYARWWPKGRASVDKARKEYIENNGETDLKRSWEYASHIIEALETNNPTVIYGSVPNTGLIDNLPQHGVVEVPCLVNDEGIQPVHVGPLPPQCAAICDWNMRMIDLAANACIHKSIDTAAHALMLDPLTAAVCSPGEIRNMTLELFEAEKPFLPGFS